MARANSAPAPNGAKTKTFTVDLASGGTVDVLSATEKDWFNASRDRYLAETRFTENTDVQDLDRLLQLELLMWRHNQWMLSGRNYDGEFVDEKDLHSKMKVLSETIHKLKDQMGLTRKVRDVTGASVADRWTELLRRAKVFEYHREDQLRNALVLMARLSAIVGSYDRGDAEERKKLGFESESDIIKWVRETMLPEYQEIDAHFVNNVQRMWVKL